MRATATLFGIFISTPKNKKPSSVFRFLIQKRAIALFFLLFFYDIIVQYSTRVKLNES